MEAQDLETPEDGSTITERLLEVQQLHSQLAKQAEQRTALIGKVRRTAAEPGLKLLGPQLSLFLSHVHFFTHI